MKLLLKLARIFLMILIVGGLLGSASLPVSAQAGVPELFGASDFIGTQGVVSPAIMRSRFVSVDFTSLLASVTADTTPDNSPDFIFNLFQDVTYSAVVENIRAIGINEYSWTGTIDASGYFTMVYVDNTFMAHIASPDGIYEVKFAGEGVYRIEQIDQSVFIDDDDAVSPSMGDLGTPFAPVTPDIAATSTQIDVLVVYTQAAETAVGGPNAMAAMIATAFTEANQSYLNSNVTQNVSSVYSKKIEYEESSISVDLTRLRDYKDGFMDDVHALRSQYGADLVVLITKSYLPTCGISYQMDNITPSFTRWAFAVVAYDCATGYYSFAHEMGHIMGARHDWENDTAQVPARYAHGYVHYTGTGSSSWRTIMAYGTECTNGCDRVNYWSNPNIDYFGNPMGIADPPDLTLPPGIKPSENWAVLNSSAATIASFADGLPVNDEFSRALLISSGLYTSEINTEYALDNSYDPSPAVCGFQPVGRSVWYKFIPSTTGQVRIDTLGSDYDTVLMVWRGTLPNLSSVGCNDDFGNVVQSSLTLSLTAGVTYYIEIGEYNTSTDISSLGLPMLRFHVYSATFADVPISHWAWNSVERLNASGITTGCGNGKYCPSSPVTRAQMAVFLERSMHGAGVDATLTATGTVFSDVSINYWAAKWIEALKTDGVTAGCGNGKYCPDNNVSRAEMAVFLLRGKYGGGYLPPSTGGTTGFSDVPNTHWAAAWIKQLAAENITSGCASGMYCPDSAVTRDQMAVFLVRTFSLP